MFRRGRDCLTMHPQGRCSFGPSHSWCDGQAILHQARSQGLEASTRAQRENFVGWLEGMIAYTRMVNPEKGLKLQQQLEQLNP